MGLGVGQELERRSSRRLLRTSRINYKYIYVRTVSKKPRGVVRFEFGAFAHRTVV